MITIDQLKKLDGRISYAPVGVIRLEYAKDRLYHFYSEQAPAILMENIHTHPHSFTSTIIKGGIRNHLYRVEDSMVETEHCVRSFAFRTKGAKIKMEQSNVTYDRITTFDTYSDGEYRIHYTAMHMINILVPKTITHLSCSPHIGALRDVYFVMKKNVSYDKEELRNLKTEDECWEIVADTLA